MNNTRNNKRWSEPEDTKLKTLIRVDKNPGEIAAELGRSPGAVIARASYLRGLGVTLQRIAYTPRLKSEEQTTPWNYQTKLDLEERPPEQGPVVPDSVFRSLKEHIEVWGTVTYNDGVLTVLRSDGACVTMKVKGYGKLDIDLCICGAPAALSYPQVKCTKCGISGPKGDNARSCAEKWNAMQKAMKTGELLS